VKLVQKKAGIQQIKAHVAKLEQVTLSSSSAVEALIHTQILRVLDNDSVEPSRIDDVKDHVLEYIRVRSTITITDYLKDYAPLHTQAARTDYDALKVYSDFDIYEVYHSYLCYPPYT
jgi:hypothetical protein